MSDRTVSSNNQSSGTPRGTLDRLSNRREERSRGRRAAAESRRRRRKVQRIVLAAIAAIALLAGGVYAYDRMTYVEPGEFVPDQGRDHVPEGQAVTTYNSDPPTSGPHWPRVASWGVHAEPVPDELQVHNLEHGGVIIQYNCLDCPELVEQLRPIATQYPVKLILAPRPDMEPRIAMTAWNRILTLEEVDEGRMQAFIDAYIDRGPERIPQETQQLNRYR